MNFDMPKAVFCGLALIAAAIYFGPGSSPADAHARAQREVSIAWANKTQEWREETERWIRETKRWIYRMDTEYKAEQDAAQDVVLAKSGAVASQLSQIQTDLDSLRSSLRRTQKVLEIIERR